MYIESLEDMYVINLKSEAGIHVTKMVNIHSVNSGLVCLVFLIKEVL